MQKQGWGHLKVFGMWLSLTIMTAIGAGFGYWLGGGIDHAYVVIIEGLAAGAMLTMIGIIFLLVFPLKQTWNQHKNKQ